MISGRPCQGKSLAGGMDLLCRSTLGIVTQRCGTPLSLGCCRVSTLSARALTGRRNAACKVQQMVSRTSSLSSEAVMGVLRLSNLGVEHCYLDPSPYNEAGAGYFVYGLPGAQQRALTMVSGPAFTGS